MSTHNINETPVNFHGEEGERKLAREFLQGHNFTTKDVLNRAEKNGKSHFEIEGKKFTVEYDSEKKTHSVRLRGLN